MQAERLLGGDPGADSARVEQFFNQAAHVHGRGLGSTKQRPLHGAVLDQLTSRPEAGSAMSVLPLLPLLLAMAVSVQEEECKRHPVTLQAQIFFCSD